MISIIIPCYNEVHAIGDTIRQCRRVLEEHFPEGEIVVVNDGSTDGSLAIIEELGVTCVQHVENLGYGISLKHGIGAARHDTMAILDADGTYPVESLPAMYTQFAKGYDLLVGNRSNDFKDRSAAKKAFRAVLLFIVRFTTGTKIPDVNSGMRIFRKSTLGEFLPYLSDGFSFTTSQTIICLLKKKTVGFFPIAYGKRTGTSKVRIIRDSLRTMQFITELIVLFNPLKLFLLLSVLPFLVAVAGVAGYAIRASQTSVLVAVLGFLVGVLVISLGFLAVCFRK